MSKIVTFSPESKDKLIKGVNILADAVGITLGPKGRNVVIDTYGVPSVTKDGVTVANQITLVEPVENLGAQIVKQAAARTAREAGDGTTTATVLAQTLVNEGKKLIDSGITPIEVKRGYEKLLGDTRKEILSMTKPVTLENVKQIATISANNDEEMGSLIFQGFEFVGTEGTIAVEDSKLGDTFVDTIEGASYNTGMISPYFATDPTKGEAIYEKPLILITDKKIRHTQEIVPVLDLVAKQARPLIIIADELEAQALALLVLNRMRIGYPVVAVRAPGFGERRSELLQDLAIMTGGTLISDIQSLRLEDVKVDQLGSCDKIVVTKDKTLIMAPAGKSEKVLERVEEIKAGISDPNNTSYAIEKMNERMANLTGKIAVLYVGAATETEVKEKKDRIDDALRATKSAIALGYVEGAGLALYNVSNKIFDRSEGGKITSAYVAALRAPFNKIVTNAGEEAEKVYDKAHSLGKGYNALTNEYVDLVEAGVIDPTLVVIEAITNAVSAANMVLLSEVTIHSDQPKFNPRAGTEMEDEF